MIYVSEVEFKKFIREHNWISKQSNKVEFSNSKNTATIVDWFSDNQPTTKIATHINYSDKDSCININTYYIRK